MPSMPAALLTAVWPAGLLALFVPVFPFPHSVCSFDSVVCLRAAALFLCFCLESL